MSDLLRIQLALSLASEHRDDSHINALTDELRRMAKAKETQPRLRKAIRKALANHTVECAAAALLRMLDAREAA